MPFLGKRPFGAAIFLWCHCQDLCLTVKWWLYMKSHCELLHKTHNQLATHLREDCREKGLWEREREKLSQVGRMENSALSVSWNVWFESVRQRKFKLRKSLCQLIDFVLTQVVGALILLEVHLLQKPNRCNPVTILWLQPINFDKLSTRLFPALHANRHPDPVTPCHINICRMLF